MKSRTIALCSFACATLLTVSSLAQDNPPSQSGEIDLNGLPASHGIYYRAASEWVALPSSVLMPFQDERAVALQILNVGSDHTVAELPGSHAGVQIGNDARPRFYLHGINPSELYLVRVVRKSDSREVRMPISRNFREWAHFNAKDMTGVDIEAVNGDVVVIRPRSDLKPGEYALASVANPGDRWIRLGYSFGLIGARTGQ